MTTDFYQFDFGHELMSESLSFANSDSPDFWRTRTQKNQNLGHALHLGHGFERACPQNFVLYHFNSVVQKSFTQKTLHHRQRNREFVNEIIFWYSSVCETWIEIFGLMMRRNRNHVFELIFMVSLHDIIQIIRTQGDFWGQPISHNTIMPLR